MTGTLLGGIGLFLLGMGLLTDGLHTAAGSALRRVLHTYTRNQLAGVATGAVVTALVQSSSVATIAVVGFVGAGLLPLAQALGVIYGANVGTTITGWIVATVGLKVQMSVLALPIVGLGAVGKLFLRGRASAFATALAGFGLLFVGIDVLQAGMADLAERLDPAQYASDTVLGYVALVVIGALMTVVMQSSSAAVATTLTAVHSGALGLQHAAALVIGQNIGTTVTALLGAVGGSVAARRIALAHLAFNLGTALVALLMLPVFVAWIVDSLGSPAPAVALTAFHSAFNVLGVLIFLPLSSRLLALLERLVPDRSQALTHRLASLSAKGPAIAVEAARATAIELAAIVFVVTRDLLAAQRSSAPAGPSSEDLHAALRSTRAFLTTVRSDPSTLGVYRDHVRVLHALDHVQQLLEATDERDHAVAALGLPSAGLLLHELGLRLEDATRWLATPTDDDVAPLSQTARAVADFRRAQRHVLLERTARGEVDAAAAESALEALGWLERVSYHAWRAALHIERADGDTAAAT